MAEQVTAPMVGKVLEVQCKVGDKVEEDQVILLLEAMKMEIPVVSPIAGVVKELKVAPGDTVESDTVLAVIE
ncbi:MAG: acetyl-CoA carboxylase biotin carboxyl carrier protein subunit [Acidobacteria bacterium RIFCSPLOWO2_02_FULL_60_20]|nr:MAG: acetyl-CoA carboxylase biotin carboxyl carrier protein subunit [Acidobacteria bacterium RIFCSPLOWO2_02_FULL_60_20]